MIKLVRPAGADWEKLCEMMAEWTASGETIVPYSIRVCDCSDRERYLSVFVQEEHGVPGHVPASTYFCLDTERDVLVGAVNIRHRLNESLLQDGGHIGDGVRPSERRKGYATRMISLALDKCRELGIQRVLMTCGKQNIGSAKSIRKNGGVLENEIDCGGETIQRYWIDLGGTGGIR